MERKESKVIELDPAVKSKEEVAHEQELKNDIGRNLIIDIFVAFPSVLQRADIELRGTNEFGFLTPITLQYR